MKILRQALQAPAGNQEPADQEGALSWALTCATGAELVIKIIARPAGLTARAAGAL